MAAVRPHRRPPASAINKCATRGVWRVSSSSRSIFWLDFFAGSRPGETRGNCWCFLVLPQTMKREAGACFRIPPAWLRASSSNEICMHLACGVFFFVLLLYCRQNGTEMTVICVGLYAQRPTNSVAWLDSPRSCAFWT